MKNKRGVSNGPNGSREIFFFVIGGSSWDQGEEKQTLPLFCPLFFPKFVARIFEMVSSSDKIVDYIRS